MSSKLKTTLKKVLEQNRQLRSERQRLVRSLAAVIYHLGPVNIPFSAACEVEEEDQVEITFNKADGSYTLQLRGVDNAIAVGSGSEEVGVSRGEGDVAGPLPEGESISISDEVREGDQHNPKPFSIVRIDDPESGGTE